MASTVNLFGIALPVLYYMRRCTTGIVLQALYNRYCTTGVAQPVLYCQHCYCQHCYYQHCTTGIVLLALYYRRCTRVMYYRNCTTSIVLTGVVLLTLGTLRSTTRQARRRGLQNKSILNKKQREWIICSPKSILNILPRSVNNATLSIFTSSERRELAERWELFLNVDFNSDTTIVLAEM